MTTTHVNEKNFDAEVAHADKLVLIDFYADWCGPCKRMAPEVEAYSNEHPEVKVVKINVDESRQIADAFGIRSVPTLMTMKDGEAVAGTVGAMPKSGIEHLVAETNKKLAAKATPPKPGHPSL